MTVFILSFLPVHRRSDRLLLHRPGNITVDTREVEPNMRECTFNVLTPGRYYTISVATMSRNLSSSVSVEGRTGVFTLSITSNHFVTVTIR